MNQQELMTEAYKGWDTNAMNYNEFVHSLCWVSRTAVLLGNLNYQVCNGGFMQWCDNGYCTEIYTVIQTLRHMNSPMAKRLIEMLGKVEETLNESVIDGTMKSTGWSNYFKKEYSETTEEDCGNCGGSGEVDGEECPVCLGDGVHYVEHDIPNFDKLDTEYYTFNEEFLKEIETYLENFGTNVWENYLKSLEK